MASSKPAVFESPGRFPFMVGVYALWPAELIKLATGSSSFPVCHAPWTITYLLMATFLSISMVTGFPNVPDDADQQWRRVPPSRHSPIPDGHNRPSGVS